MAVAIYTGAGENMPLVDVAAGARIHVSQVVGGNGMPECMGVGLASYEGAWDYHLNYDVAYYMLQGSLNVHTAGAVLTARAGDVVYMERGTDLRYETAIGGCKLFWAAYPGNWEEITALPERV